MVARIRQTETHAQTMRRLAESARQGGCELYLDEITGAWFATSRRNPGKLHQLTAISCTCPGFIRTAACGHVGMLLEELHYLGPDDDDEPDLPIAAVVECDACDAVMEHINGVTFGCQCGAEYALAWDTATEIDALIVARSQDDPEFVDQITILLSAEGIGIPRGADPDLCISREDVPAILGRYQVSANDVAAALVWRAELDARDEVAA
jgi:hypothetical protein